MTSDSLENTPEKKKSVLYLHEMFMREPTEITPAALDKWRELPRINISNIKTAGVVAQNLYQKDYWTGVYDYYG